MKRLYLLRHAKSSWDDPGLLDRERPLAPRGKKAAAKIATHLRTAEIRPELVLCSSAVRARQTLEAIEPVLEGADIEIEDGLYEAAGDGLLERLRGVPEGVGSVMLIAHNPGLQDLALELAAGGDDIERLREKFPTAALATLEPAGGWRDLSPGAVRLVDLVLARDIG
jgi:phosphohistidine phosphatase